MGFTLVKPVASKGKAQSGIRFGLKTSTRTGKRQASLSMNAAALKDAFGVVNLHTMRLQIACGRGQDHGFLEVTVQAGGSCKPRALVAGSAMIILEPWDILPSGDHPSQECTVYEKGEGRIVLRLPAWAQERQKSASGVTLA